MLGLFLSYNVKIYTLAIVIKSSWPFHQQNRMVSWVKLCWLLLRLLVFHRISGRRLRSWLIIGSPMSMNRDVHERRQWPYKCNEVHCQVVIGEDVESNRNQTAKKQELDERRKSRKLLEDATHSVFLSTTSKRGQPTHRDENTGWLVSEGSTYRQVGRWRWELPSALRTIAWRPPL